MSLDARERDQQWKVSDFEKWALNDCPVLFSFATFLELTESRQLKADVVLDSCPRAVLVLSSGDRLPKP